MGSVAPIGNISVKSGSTFQSFTAPSVEAAEFFAVVKECSVGLSFRCICIDLGIQMKKLKSKVSVLRRIL